MPPSELYRTPGDLPNIVPVFPLPGALLLPRTQLPLNIFEDRYLTMINDAIAGDRLIGMIQPGFEVDAEAIGNPSARPQLQAVGCVGRITSFAETSDRRMLITLTGVCRFKAVREVPLKTGYRRFEIDCSGFAGDLEPGEGEVSVDREALLDALRAYLDASNMAADWGALNKAETETLVNGLCAVAPYGPKEKQALLEAPDLKSRSEMLIAVTEMALASSGDDTGTTLQ